MTTITARDMAAVWATVSEYEAILIGPDTYDIAHSEARARVRELYAYIAHHSPTITGHAQNPNPSDGGALILADAWDSVAKHEDTLNGPDRAVQDVLLGHAWARIRIDELHAFIAHCTPTA